MKGARRRSAAAAGRLQRRLGTRGHRIVFLTGSGSRKARNLRRDPRMALSIAPDNDSFEPVIVRGRVADERTALIVPPSAQARTIRDRSFGLGTDHAY